MARPLEKLGALAGAAIAPAFGLGSLIRRARIFHPEGVCHRATAVVAPGTPFETAAIRLAGEGPALVRFSAAWWRGGREWPDVLGCAIRFGGGDPEPLPREGEQDLLLATIPRPILTLAAPLWTDTHHFLANTYHATAPFDLEGVGRVRLRLTALPFDAIGESRVERLERAVERGVAVLLLSVRRVRPFARWRPLVELRVGERLDVDQEALRFDPFANGRGLVPRGFVHNLRRATYALSQQLRPTESATPARWRTTAPRAPGLRKVA
jgi:hypothetical protein